MSLGWTASASDRGFACAAGFVLPKAERPAGPAASHGTRVHRFLRRALVIGRAAALDEVRAEGAEQTFYDLCNSIDLAPLFELGRVASSEMAWAYDVATGTARAIGENRGRDYGELGPMEIAGTTDLEMADEIGCIVVDFKTGALPHPNRERAQLRVNALMVGTYRAAKRVRTVIFRIDDDGGSKLDWYDDLDEWGLDDVRHAVRSAADRILAARAIVAVGGVPDVRTGEHCVYCPGKVSCPAYVSLARELASNAATRDQIRNGVAAMFPDEAGVAWARLERAEEILAHIRAALVERMVDEGHLPLPDGREVYLNEQWPESVDVRKAFEFDPVLASFVVQSITKGQLEAHYGKETKKTADVYARLRAAGVLVRGDKPRLMPTVRRLKVIGKGQA